MAQLLDDKRSNSDPRILDAISKVEISMPKRMRNVTEEDLFGVTSAENIIEPTKQEAKVLGFRRQAEHGPKKFIKP